MPIKVLVETLPPAIRQQLLQVPDLSSASVEERHTQAGQVETQARSLDNRANPWLADFKIASTLIPTSLLPQNQSVVFFSRVYR